MRSIRWIFTLPVIIGSGQASFGQPAVLPTVTMYWTDIGTDLIQRARHGAVLVENLVEADLRTPVAITLDIEGGKLYWADQATHTVGRANLDGSSPEVIVSTASRDYTHPLGVAVDPGAGKVYWTEWCDSGCAISSVRRANLDGSSMEILIDTDISFPTGIALDIGAGQMYWFDGRIYRANFDGSDRQTLVGAGAFDGAAWDIELDVAAGHIYWAEKNGPVKRADLSDGSNVQTIVANPKTHNGLGLDLFARKIYWSTGDGIYRANMDGTDIEIAQDALHDAIGLAIHSVLPSRDNRYVTVPDPFPSTVATGQPTEFRRVTFLGRCDAGSNEAGECTGDVNCPGAPSGACRLGGFPYPSQSFLYVGPPLQAPDEDTSKPAQSFAAAPLHCEPSSHQWSVEGAIAIYGAEIVPDGEYKVERADSSCPDLSDPACWSALITVRTAKYGDVWPLFSHPLNPSQPDFKDIAAIVRKFQGAPSECDGGASAGLSCAGAGDCPGGTCDITAPRKPTSQLQPNVVFPKRSIDFRDIAAAVGAFAGAPYVASSHGPCPCPSAVTCGATACANDLQCDPGLCVDGFCGDECGRCTSKRTGASTRTRRRCA